MRRGIDRKGFTLIELLLAIVMFSVLSLSVYTVFSQGLKVERHLKAGGMGQDFYWPLKQIALDLEKMVSYTSGENPAGYFIGEHERISFVIAEDHRLKQVSYYLSSPELTEVRQVKVNAAIVQHAGEVLLREDKTAPDTMVLARRERVFPFSGSGEDDENMAVAKLADNGMKIFYLHDEGEGRVVWGQRIGNKPVKAVRIDLAVLDERGRGQRAVRDIFLPVSPSGGKDAL